MKITRRVMRGGPLAAAILLSACGDLGRSDVEQILNGEGRGYACQTTLNFADGGFEKARAAGAFSNAQGGLIGASLKVADSSDGDQWQVSCLIGMCGGIGRKTHGNRCLPGHVEVLAIADAPFAQGSGSYKSVDYVEIVDLPPELSRVAAFVYTRYKKSAIFQKTDNGWRVMQ